MVDIAQKYKDELPNIKKNIENSYEYFSENCKNFHQMRNFIFVSNLNERDKAVLQEYNKPLIEFNSIERYISDLRGEFSKQIPEIEVTANQDTPVDAATVKVVDMYIRYIMNSPEAKNVANQVYTDILSGGFSAVKVYTDYANSRSFNQEIKYQRVYDPTLVGFDPLAREPHKGDGQYCFECFPKTEEEFKAEFPNVNINDIGFSRTASINNFNWSYSNKFKKILMLVDYYEIKKKKTKLLKLSDGKVMLQNEYEDMKNKFEQGMMLGQPIMPIVVQERNIEIPIVHRYKIIQNKVLEHQETNFSMLPIIFIDGNSIITRKAENSNVKQITRSYVHNVIGAQRLKNISGQTLANHIEKLTQHKWVASLDAIPKNEAYQRAYIEPQKAQVLTYNEFKDGNPDVRVTPPKPVPPEQLSAEVTSAFGSADQMIQGILGASDASLGKAKAQLSGIALVESASRANPTAMPYIINYMAGIQRLAEIIVDLIPKYYMTPRSLPIMTKDEQREYVLINQPGGINLNYSSNSLNINVKAGYNFSVQKAKALQQYTALMTAAPQLAEFLTSAEGIKFILDNIEARGIDELKVKYQQFMAQQQAKAQAAQQSDPQMLKAQAQMMEAQTEAQKAQSRAQLDAASIAVDKEKSDNERLKILGEIHDEQQKRFMQAERDQTERIGQAVDLAVKAADMSHNHAKDVLEMAKTEKNNE